MCREEKDAYDFYSRIRVFFCSDRAGKRPWRRKGPGRKGDLRKGDTIWTQKKLCRKEAWPGKTSSCLRKAVVDPEWPAREEEASQYRSLCGGYQAKGMLIGPGLPPEEAALETVLFRITLHSRREKKATAKEKEKAARRGNVTLFFRLHLFLTRQTKRISPKTVMFARGEDERRKGVRRIGCLDFCMRPRQPPRLKRGP